MPVADPKTCHKSCRRFVLRRLEDIHGCSGTGIVAQGVEFWNGKATLCWFPGPAGVSSVSHFESVEEVIALHGHDGKTVVDYIDRETSQEMGSTEIEAETGTVKLTKREREVLWHVAHGRSSKAIGDLLFVSKRTIDFHLANIYDRLNVSNRIQALNEAKRLSLLPVADPAASPSRPPHPGH